MNESGTKGRVLLSQVLTWLLLGGLGALAALLPYLLKGYLAEYASPAVSSSFTPVLILCYCALAPGFFAGILMLGLLRRVKKGLIFVSPSAVFIQLLAVCCFVECGVFALLAKFFLISAGVAFAALFLGIALLVVADVVAAGTEIKKENDFTV